MYGGIGEQGHDQTAIDVQLGYIRSEDTVRGLVIPDAVSVANVGRLGFRSDALEQFTALRLPEGVPRDLARKRL